MQQKFAHIIQRYNTASIWASNNPVLLTGELGIESDTGKAKLGDGSTPWNTLDYCISMGSVNPYTVSNGLLLNDLGVLSAQLRYEVVGEQL